MSWEAFKQAARLEEPEQVPVGLIVDSPWLPGYAGIDTRDYYLLPDRWLTINKGLLDRFPEAVWMPGFWVEYGMAAEPSGFGVKLHFYANRPPSVEPVMNDLAAWSDVGPANPNEDGLMPLVLRAYTLMEDRLRADGHRDREGQRPQTLVGVQEHRDGQRGDVRREQEVDEPAEPPAAVARRPPVRAGVDPLEQQRVAEGDLRQVLDERVALLGEGAGRDESVERPVGDRTPDPVEIDGLQTGLRGLARGHSRPNQDRSGARQHRRCAQQRALVRVRVAVGRAIRFEDDLTKDLLDPVDKIWSVSALRTDG